MDTNSFPIRRFKAQLSKFSGIISKPFCKTTQRFFREMLYGIQASQDVKLSNIGRSLQEDIALIKTEDRLSRNLSKEDFSDHINSEIIRLADDKITDEMVISIDPGDPDSYPTVYPHLFARTNHHRSDKIFQVL